MQNVRTKRPGESGFGWLMLAVSLWLLFEAWRIAGFSALSSPGAFPIAAAFSMVAASIVTVVNNLKLAPSTTGAAGFVREVTPPVVVIYLLVIIGFALLLEPIGFVLSALAFLFVSILYLSGGRPVRAAAISLLALVAIYVIFRLVFQVVLPEGILPEREWMAAIGRLFEGGAP